MTQTPQNRCQAFSSMPSYTREQSTSQGLKTTIKLPFIPVDELVLTINIPSLNCTVAPLENQNNVLSHAAIIYAVFLPRIQSIAFSKQHPHDRSGYPLWRKCFPTTNSTFSERTATMLVDYWIRFPFSAASTCF
mmetsp:Transcript_16851/g.34742  ORF Transcript_16851/g.34742 Transcript_16851/m.34742 type:complete len:134 (-) Transcript_16851:175-576(-)